MIDADALDESVRVPVHLDGSEATVTVADVDRPDLGRKYPEAGGRHGFDVTIPVEPGAHDVCVYESEEAADIEFEGPGPLECQTADAQS